MSDETSDVLSGYLSQQELAAQLNLKLRTLQLWEARREGPPVTRLGKRPLYRREAVAAWLASSRDAACPRQPATPPARRPPSGGAIER